MKIRYNTYLRATPPVIRDLRDFPVMVQQLEKRTDLVVDLFITEFSDEVCLGSIPIPHQLRSDFERFLNILCEMINRKIET